MKVYIDQINELLGLNEDGLDYGLTIKGDQLKGMGSDKHYLDATDCEQLGRAFLHIAKGMSGEDKATPQGLTKEAGRYAGEAKRLARRPVGQMFDLGTSDE